MPTEETVIVSSENMSKTNGGKFQGWGTSLCWWANRVGYSEPLTEKTAELFFSQNGLGMNIMRYNIGGGDDPRHKHITRSDSAVPGWAVCDAKSGTWSYDVTADKNQLNVLKSCYSVAGEDAYVEVFSNSPPYFMTVSGCSSGNADPAKDNLDGERYEDFARYLAFVTAYINNELGVKVGSVSPMNEPGTDFWQAYGPKQEGCHFEMGSSQSRIITAVAEEFKKSGLSDIEIVVGDETGCEYQYKAYTLLSEEAKRSVSRINTHTYDENGIEKLGKFAREKGINLWMSEVDGGNIAGENAGEMGAALWFSQKVIHDLNALYPSAWIMWQTIDSHISKDGYNGNPDRGMVDTNGGYWGLAVADHDNGKVLLTQKYYAIGQFSRYIRPGMTIINCDDSTLAAYDKVNERAVIVAVNGTAYPKPTRFVLKGFVDGGHEVKSVRTCGDIENGEHWKRLPDIKAEPHGFSAKLKANSVTTFILDGVKFEKEHSDEI